MPEDIYIQVKPNNITFVNKIMEGYEYLGMVSTIDREKGILIIRSTPDFYAEVLDIINNLPIEVAVISPV